MDLEPAVDTLCSIPEVVKELEESVMTWQTHMAIVIEEQQHKHPQVSLLLFLCSEFLTLAGVKQLAHASVFTTYFRPSQFSSSIISKKEFLKSTLQMLLGPRSPPVPWQRLPSGENVHQL